MPGIAGLITKLPRAHAEELLSRMVGALCHETFYETGTWIDESLGVYVGWAVRKGSFSDGLPITNERGDVSLVFSGEEYSDLATIKRLKEDGHSLGKARASYLVHLYEDDPDFLLRLNGLFHGLLIDRAQGIATLFNDRYGMHRLCYHQSQDVFYFAAEAKAILSACPTLRAADPRSIGEYVACSCVLGNRTIFKEIQVLPAASAWTFRGGTLERKCTYFQTCQWEKQEALDSESYYKELRKAFSRNLALYFSDLEQTGMTLTGGMDTRMIMAWHKAAPRSLPCYTFGGAYRECQDVLIGRRIADLCEQTYEVIPIGQEFLSKFPHYAERSLYLTEGGVDVYRASDLYVSEKARKIAPAKVVGTYGSEIIRRAVMFKAVKPPEGLFKPEFLSQVGQAQSTYADLRREHPLTFAAFRQSPWYHQGILALESSQLTVRSPYLDNDFVRTVYCAPKSRELPKDDIRLRLIRDGNPALAKLLTDRGIGNPADPISEIKHAFMEFTFKAEYGYDYGMPQSVSRIDHALSALRLERIFLGRHKTSHFRVWYRDQLSSYVREILLDRQTLSRPYLNPQTVGAIVNGHTKKGLNYTTAIHKLLSLELLQRTLLDSR
jgi:asparagine synthase (glutamine-hydrolysing)